MIDTLLEALSTTPVACIVTAVSALTMLLVSAASLVHLWRNRDHAPPLSTAPECTHTGMELR